MHAPDSLPTTAPRRGRRFVSLGLVVVALLTFSVLSPPPLLLLADRYTFLQEGPGDQVLGVVFAPWGWISERSPAMQSFNQWYFFEVWHLPQPDFEIDTAAIVESLVIKDSTNAPPQ